VVETVVFPLNFFCACAQKKIQRQLEKKFLPIFSTDCWALQAGHPGGDELLADGRSWRTTTVDGGPRAWGNRLEPTEGLELLDGLDGRAALDRRF
jgi:hypothetical protein